MSEPAPLSIQLVVSPQGCRKCAECEAMVGRLQERYPGRIDYRKIQADAPEAEQYGVVMPPMLVVGNLVVSMGRAPREDALGRLVAERLQEGQSQ